MIGMQIYGIWRFVGRSDRFGEKFVWYVNRDYKRKLFRTGVSKKWIFSWNDRSFIWFRYYDSPLCVG